MNSNAIAAELAFYRHEAALRGHCDGCGERNKLLALIGEVWLCWACNMKADAAKDKGEGEKIEWQKERLAVSAQSEPVWPEGNQDHATGTKEDQDYGNE